MLGWDLLKVLQDGAIEGPWAVHGQVPVHLLVQLADAGGAFDQEGAVRLGMDLVTRGRCHGGGEVTDNLFQDVVQGDQPLNIAIFVDNKANSLLVALELGQLHVEGVPWGMK